MVETTSNDGGSTVLAADDAFAVLGNGIRLGILQALGEADGPLSFSELQDRVGTRDSGQFNYHLEKLAGHFLHRTDAGYRLREAGRRVVEAVYSGVLTGDPPVERVELDWPCSRCGTGTEMQVTPGSIELYCTECPGIYGAIRGETPADRGYLGRLALPPAGLEGRTPEEVYRAAQVWGHLELLSVANDVCPRCSARLEPAVEVCEEHDDAEELCGACGNRYAVTFASRCTNCIFHAKASMGAYLFGHPAVQAFKVNHGHNLVAPSAGKNPLSDLAEEVLSTDSFEARFTFAFEDEELVLAVDDDLAITTVAGPEDAGPPR